MLNSGLKSSRDGPLLTRDDFFEFMEKHTTTQSAEGIDLGNYSYFVGMGRKCLKLFHKKEISCDFLASFLGIIDRLYTLVSNPEELKKFAMSINKGELLFRCLDPSICLKRITDAKPRSIIMSSGTLGNLEEWEANLKISFAQKISAESFITPHQLYAQIKPKSSNGVPFNFSYHGKQNDLQFQELATEFKRLEEFVTGGIVVAFSNYEIMEKALRHSTSLSKKVFFETKGGNVEAIFRQYSEEVAKSGAFLFIIMKGRFSEGINFADDLCRCLVVIGIPYLPAKDPSIVEKMGFIEEERSKSEASEWYARQSFRPLNQTIGRAIRNRNDYSIILLVDQRYLREDNQVHLSEWFKKCLRPSNN